MADRSTLPDPGVLDAARAAKAAQVEHAEASVRFGNLEDQLLAAMGPAQCPPRPDSDEGRAIVSSAMVNLLRQFPALTPEVERATLELRWRTTVDMTKAHDAWAKEMRRRRVETGCAAAEDEWDRTSDAEIDSFRALTETRATTLDGLLAKASVFRESPDDDGLLIHHQALALSVMRDLQAMLSTLGFDLMAERAATRPAGATRAPASSSRRPRP